MKKKVMIQSRWDLSFQQTKIHNIEAVNSSAYLGTELMRENEKEVEIEKRIMSTSRNIFSYYRHS